MKVVETEIWIPAKNGVGIPPKFLECNQCGGTMRPRPGHRYVCIGCGTVTTLDMKPLAHKKNLKIVLDKDRKS